MRASVPRHPKRLPVFAIILVSVAGGYALAVTKWLVTPIRSEL